MRRVGLLGGSGRMGRLVAELLTTAYGDRAVLAAAPGRGEPWDELLNCEVIIDFSSPEGTLALLETTWPPMIASGTTGWTEDQRTRLETLAADRRILLASNFSSGVMALRHILRRAAPLLDSLGYTPVLSETHHRYKRDAPSGTALTLMGDVAPDDPGSVQVHATRAGEVIGDHRLDFYGPADVISIGHHAQNRGIFARGAIEVAMWMASAPREKGLMDMDDYFSEVLARSEPGDRRGGNRDY